jgi:hypothetical protein
VLVRDPAHQLLGQPVGVVDQRGGEDRDRAGQRDLLGALGLVAAVERPVEQLGVGTEQVVVEPAGDLLDVLGHHRQRRLDDRRGLLGQHACGPPSCVRIRSPSAPR